MATSGFICRDDYLEKTAKLSDEELGRLFRALMVYHATGNEIDMQGRESLAFDFIKVDIDNADQAYKERCEKNRQNRLGTNDNDRQRSSTVDNDCDQSSTVVNEGETPNIILYSINNTSDKDTIDKEKTEEKERVKREKEERFSLFWSRYPRKEDKKKAKSAFLKINPDEVLLNTMLEAIEKQRASPQWQEDGGQYIPHPSTWLNGRRWEDEVITGGNVNNAQHGRNSGGPQGAVRTDYSDLPGVIRI